MKAHTITLTLSLLLSTGFICYAGEKIPNHRERSRLNNEYATLVTKSNPDNKERIKQLLSAAAIATTLKDAETALEIQETNRGQSNPWRKKNIHEWTIKSLNAQEAYFRLKLADTSLSHDVRKGMNDQLYTIVHQLKELHNEDTKNPRSQESAKQYAAQSFIFGQMRALQGENVTTEAPTITNIANDPMEEESVATQNINNLGSSLIDTKPASTSAAEVAEKEDAPATATTQTKNQKKSSECTYL